MISLHYRIILLLSLSTCCYGTYCNDILLSLSQALPLSLRSLHKPLFNMTLPLDSLTLTGVSLSCQTDTGCGTLSALSLSHLDKQVNLQPPLIHFYLTSSWAYNTQFKLHLGPVSAKFLTLSLEFAENSTSPAFLISSTLYGCEASLAQVPLRQVLQYDLSPLPSTPDLDYTGLTGGQVASGGVGKLMDGDTRAHLEWHSSVEQKLHLLFRFDRAYNLIELELLSSDSLPSPATPINLTTQQGNCSVTTNSVGFKRIRLYQCSYLFLTLNSAPGLLSLSEVRIRSESGLLSGKRSPTLSPAPTYDANVFNVATLVAILITFFLTSLLCLFVVTASCFCLRRRSGFHRWFSRSHHYNKHKGDYTTMKTSDKSCSDPAQPQEMDTEHHYATLNIPGDLETSAVYVDMSSSAKNTSTRVPTRRAPPPPTGPEAQYMSMRIRAGSGAGSGGFLARLRERIAQVKSSHSPQPPLDTEQGEDILEETASNQQGKTSGNMSRRGGIKMKSNSGTAIIPSHPPPPPPLCGTVDGRDAGSEAPDQPVSPGISKEAECNISRKGAIKLK